MKSRNNEINFKVWYKTYRETGCTRRSLIEVIVNRIEQPTWSVIKGELLDQIAVEIETS